MSRLGEIGGSDAVGGEREVLVGCEAQEVVAVGIAQVVQVCDAERTVATSSELVNFVLKMVEIREGRLRVCTRVWAGWVG